MKVIGTKEKFKRSNSSKRIHNLRVGVDFFNEQTTTSSKKSRKQELKLTQVTFQAMDWAGAVTSCTVNEDTVHLGN